MFFRIWFRQRLVAGCAGTAGTLAALPLAFVLCLLGIDGWILLLLCIALFFWGIRICGYTERELGIQDYGGIVWDEIVAMLLVLSLIPFKWSWWLAAFVIFRLFDALKPWPIKWFDRRIHGGLGIMLDGFDCGCDDLDGLRPVLLDCVMRFSVSTLCKNRADTPELSGLK